MIYDENLGEYYKLRRVVRFRKPTKARLNRARSSCRLRLPDISTPSFRKT